MIAKLDSTATVLLDTFNNVSGSPKVEVFNLVIDSEGYTVNGQYFYETIENEGEENEVITRHPIANINSHFTVAEIQALCTALGAPNVNAIILGTLQGGLRHIVTHDGKWGLGSIDWE